VQTVNKHCVAGVSAVGWCRQSDMQFISIRRSRWDVCAN